MNKYLSPCMRCMKMTESKRIAKATYKCEECWKDKSLSDVFAYEAGCIVRAKS